MDKQRDIKIDFAAIKKQYDEHASKCKRIAKEVNKWGQKTRPQVSFLLTQR